MPNKLEKRNWIELFTKKNYLREKFSIKYVKTIANVIDLYHQMNDPDQTNDNKWTVFKWWKMNHFG